MFDPPHCDFFFLVCEWNFLCCTFSLLNFVFLLCSPERSLSLLYNLLSGSWRASFHSYLSFLWVVWNPLNLYLCFMCSMALIIFMAFHWTCTNTSVFLVLGHTKLGHNQMTLPATRWGKWSFQSGIKSAEMKVKTS